MSTFAPTHEWQDLPDDAILPPGLDIAVDLTTGAKRARLLPAFDPDAVGDFLAAWHAEGAPEATLVSVYPDRRASQPRAATFPWPHDRPQLLGWAETANQASNVYFAVNQARAVGKKPTKADVTHIAAAHADIDPTCAAPLAAERQRLLALADELAHRERPPSFVIDSGGGIQVFYRLADLIDAEPETTLAIEAVSRRLEAALGGKGTHNVDRIMRLPGTVNHPDAKKLANGRTLAQACTLHASGKLYTWPELMAAIADLEQHPPQHARPVVASKGTAAVNGHDLNAELPEPATAEQIDVLLTASGDPDLPLIWRKDPAAAPLDDTQSGWDFRLCRHLAAAGFKRPMAARYLRSYLDLHDPDCNHARRADYYERTLDTSYGATPEAWPDPVPLGEPPPAPTFPLAVLPRQVARWVEHAAASMSVPPECVALPLLVTAGAAIGKAATIQPFPHMAWTERPCLWHMTVAPKGSGKSPALTAATAGINAAEARQRERWEVVHAAWKARQEPRKKAKKELGPHVGSRDDPEPPEPKIVITDATIEAAADAMVHSKGLALVRDELSGWLLNMSRYNSGSDRPFWLTAHSGGVYRIDRVQRGRQVLHDVFCAITGGVQPDVARRAFAASRDAVDDGLLERFGLIAFPGPHPWGGLAPPAAHDAKRAVTEAIVRLAEHDPRPLRFDAAAQQTWNQWYDGHMRDVRAPGADEAPTHGWICKGPGLVLRLCVTMHWLRFTFGEIDREQEVDAPTLDSAITLFRDYCVPAYVRVAAAFGEVDAHDGAQRIIGLIVRRKLTKIRINDVARMEWRGMRERKPILAAIEVLEDRGWLRPAAAASGPRGGKPPAHWAINPAALDAE